MTRWIGRLRRPQSASTSTRGRWSGPVLALVLGLIAAICGAYPAMAQEPAEDTRCSATTVRWIEDAAQQTGVRVVPVSCHGSLVRLRLLPSGGAPIDVEIAEPPGPAFRHAGRLRVSPIVEVPDYRSLPAPQRDAFERVHAWLEVNSDRVSIAPATPQHPALTAVPLDLPVFGGWLLVLAVVLTAIAAWRSSDLHPGRRDRIAMMVIVLGALALRLGLGLWGPLHINGQAPLWIIGAASDPAQLGGYGPGYAEVFSAVASITSRSPDLAIFATNAVSSALVPAMAFALGRIAGLDRPRAVIAAAVLALDPIATRSSATESYFVPILVLTLAVSLTVAAAVRTSERSRVAAGLWLVAAAALATQAARIHPVAWIGVTLGPLAALLGGPAPHRQPRANDAPSRAVSARLAWGTVALVLFGVTLGLTSAGWIAAALAEAMRHRGGVLAHAGLPIALGLVALVVIVARPRHWTLLVVGLVWLAADVSARPVYGQSELWQACFDRLFLVVPALACAALVPGAVLERRGVSLTVAAIVLAIVTMDSIRLARSPTTEQLEYRWLRTELARVATDCRATSVLRADKRVLYVPWYAMTPPSSTESSPPSRWFEANDASHVLAATAGSACVLWIHASLCESEDGRSACAGIEDELLLTEIASVELAPVPSNDDLPYDTARVRVSIHRVEAPASE
ncbi:MAG: hypothetical protein K0V04_45635 [Deltaproteobacteria bacterium]|nr:hypothetical protein [Deltaproteobacteria bacterium]